MTEDLQPVFEHEVLLGSVVCADAGASEALRSRVIDGLVRFVKNPEMHAEGLQMNALTQDSSEPEKIVFLLLHFRLPDPVFSAPVAAGRESQF